MISFEITVLNNWQNLSQPSPVFVGADNFCTVVPSTSRSVSAQGDYDCEPDLPGDARVHKVVMIMTCQGMPPKVRRRK